MTRAPWSRAAWAKSRGNWPLPAIKPMFSDICRQQTPFRGLDKLEEVLNLRSCGDFLAHLVHGLFQLEVGEEQQFVGPFQAVQGGVGEPGPFQTHQVEANDLGPVTHR